MNEAEAIGVAVDGKNITCDRAIIDRIKLQLKWLGFDVETSNDYGEKVLLPLLSQYAQDADFSNKQMCGADIRIQTFLEKYLRSFGNYTKNDFLPSCDFICDQYGMSRVLSLPEHDDVFHSEYVDSYRLVNGILNNPSTDKRTTKEVFHVVDGDLPIPDDKISVPKNVFANMLYRAFHPEENILTLPFTSQQKHPAQLFVSNYMTPVICPAIPGIQKEQRMEIRFFVPASLVSILDCTESIFGNAGSPLLKENDIAFDPEVWCGYTGCIVFAPQLRKCTKKELGLPHISDATDRQRRDGMCWEYEDELYHDGKPFKIMARDGGKVIVSIVADSYNGYGKKEIKTQMSYVANLMGLSEEEHSGGTLVYPRFDLGDVFNYKSRFGDEYTFENTIKCCRDNIIMHDGYAVDKKYDNIVYLPESAEFILPTLQISWKYNDVINSLPLEIGKIYVMPSGYRIHVEKPDVRGARWKMIGTSSNGVFCYKPATVSGGGKSEIAKSIDGFISSGPTLVHDYKQDFEHAKEICNKDFSRRFKSKEKHDDRTLLDKNRTLGSVIKLLTPNDYYTDEYNEWIRSIPQHILTLIFNIKRFSRDFNDDDWRNLFSVDCINGAYGNELKYKQERLYEHYLRIGFDENDRWRLFALRDDFIPSEKFQLADDITVSTVFPSKNLPYSIPGCDYPSVKIVHNCEYRLYQRPDEAILPGYDVETEENMTRENLFTCNFRPLTRNAVKEMMNDSIRFAQYSDAMQNMLKNFVNDENGPSYVVCPSELRTMPNGNISKNQRYLQDRVDMCEHFKTYLVTLSARLYHRHDGNIDIRKSPVQSILSGRRNNPREVGVRPLCVYGPLHYMETPELFMEYLSSMTGKSPSTTGAGLEGAMTKGPFNCLNSVYDLNNALLGFILTEYAGFMSSAGYVGPKTRVAHDITYLLPEIWCRMTNQERTPNFLIEHKYLEKCNNFEYNGDVVQAERLGYRITRKFVRVFGARVFSLPDTIFTDDMLRPECQDMDVFVDSMSTIIDAHKRAAELVIGDDGAKDAIPPLKALLYVTAYGEYDGMRLNDQSFRELFHRDNVINSDWYNERLERYQLSQLEHLNAGKSRLLGLKGVLRCVPDWIMSRMRSLDNQISFVSSEKYIDAITGTIGQNVFVNQL